MEEKELETITKTEIATEQETKKEDLLGDLPRLEDLLKSEKEIKTNTNTELKGLQKVEQNKVEENRTFQSKQDEKKAFVKKRLKLATAVYICVAVLLFGFVIFNTATLAILDRGINSNTNTINTQSEIVTVLENNTETPADPTNPPIEISLNEPRDYSDDTRELTFLDKLTILFRNIFG
ncbi:MAG TPA: hypothetical protein IAB72_03215 [Candidatus Onthoplasma faecipullorum]|nr:hypothetical protein [Candidatus Onthoplasma faecipullorum]